MLHDPVNGTAEEGRGKDTPMTDSGSYYEAIWRRRPDPNASTRTWVEIAEKIEHNIRRADPLKAQPKSRPVHWDEGRL